ncbi:MAG: pyridoxamine 5'-phosphate oxidase [Proteobacteria bacterium]|nr:pyridoxamine 5'-phosphate oxidase [Pseudomonadota bacterium]
MDLLSSTRRDYGSSILEEGELPQSPIELLRNWVDQAIASGIGDANAMDLATIDDEGFPTSRIVLLRGITDDGLTFFTNYDSAKGSQLEHLPKASANFFWTSLERQVRVRGIAQKLTGVDSDKYFSSRPRESQIGAWASPQSTVISGRDELDSLFAKKLLEFSKIKNIPRPTNWGGYSLKPDRIEFWQGRPSRLHDRLKCELKDDKWCWSRLAP